VTALRSRLARLEDAQEDKGQIMVFRRGPEDDAALEAAKQEAERTGKLLVIVSWLNAQP
jgi:hypothetical protein